MQSTGAVHGSLERTGENASLDGGTAAAPYLSILIPIFDEEENIPLLLARVFSVLRSLPHTFEVLAIDDGSQDASFRELELGAKQYPELKIVRFRRNYGQ